ncbi:MAG TPA: NUDIX hydrolase [Patescibacteria group bacterium]|nr:NUDIX hydrolase [Patescibacteria group bacterium]
MRKTQEGEKHYTASAWILTKTNPQKLLLIKHKKFNLWLQPGGHIEKFENPIEAVIRETFEETGVDISFLSDEISQGHDGKFLPVPMFIMEQPIPPHREEPPHFHIDFMYCVEADEKDIQPAAHESVEAGWFTREEVIKLHTHQDTQMIVKKIMK